jgi:hypothetical protein
MDDRFFNYPSFWRDGGLLGDRRFQQGKQFLPYSIMLTETERSLFCSDILGDRSHFSLQPFHALSNIDNIIRRCDQPWCATLLYGEGIRPVDDATLLHGSRHA